LKRGTSRGADGPHASRPSFSFAVLSLFNVKNRSGSFNVGVPVGCIPHDTGFEQGQAIIIFSNRFRHQFPPR